MVAYDLVGIDDLMQLNLLGTGSRQRRLEIAIDELSERFGGNVVHRADDFSRASALRLAATLDFLEE